MIVAIFPISSLMIMQKNGNHLTFSYVHCSFSVALLDPLLYTDRSSLHRNRPRDLDYSSLT